MNKRNRNEELRELLGYESVSLIDQEE